MNYFEREYPGFQTRDESRIKRERKYHGLQSVEVHSKAFDLPLIFTSAFLLLTGLILIYDVTPMASLKISPDRLFYFKNQLTWATLGTFALIFLSYFNYRRLINLGPVLLLFSIISLILVLIPHVGTEVNGARRWINIGPFSFQPSEFAKLSLILYCTSVIAKFENFKIKLSDAFLVIFIPAAIVSGLVFLGPDLGTSLILMTLMLAVYFVGNGPIIHFALIFPAIISLIIPLIYIAPYRLNRIKAFLDPTSDPQGTSYHITQILKAIATGGFFGLGIGGSISKFNYIPEIQTDAIFAIYVEETGFLGAVILILAFTFLLKRAILIARNAPDYRGRILASGIAALIFAQSFFNIASNVALIPLTGVPLPFISYGGSSLFVTMAAVGILLNIKRHS